ncbi:hypothetical protein MBAV_000296 [Candidatus Magnetobacterium bavaricum]|uniref:Uncharacterized protein n=1 Tax=Candidatus Magnetobacterium bavaricum TaxID=29290 RepID=A0A0F3H3J0_9BACT|nr:hypothetical protein MBAV_000296 [Candidatus Magnetobacterium bavaricum]
MSGRCGLRGDKDNEAWDKKIEAEQIQRIEDRKEWDRKFEADKQERIAERRQWNKKWGETANRLGTLVEDIVAPNIEGLALGHFGCKRIDLFAHRIKKTSIKDRSKQREFYCIACEDFIADFDWVEYKIMWHFYGVKGTSSCQGRLAPPLAGEVKEPGATWSGKEGP